ncbi:tryptophan dimethylallyltransferase family protein [Streptomyces sp. NPDC050844]|uniref:tryptophan dimethylallyltransferase family protein n=1 Tax=Streptomyces sp. NPDC050844 TaxID=3155790 RepID=UPI003409DC61
MEAAALTPDTGVAAEMVGRPVRFESRRYEPTDSYADIACDKIRRGSEVLGGSESERRSQLALVRELFGSWGELPAGQPPERACWVAIDGMPFEVSLAWADGQSELRLSLESPSHPGTSLARQEDGRAFTRSLAGRPGVSIERYLAVEDLFTAPDPHGFFALSHGVAWRRGGHPLYKIYLNPAVTGREHAVARTEEAMIRLGMERPWRALADHLGGVHGIAHEPAALALDLSDAQEARCKVYLAHSGVCADEIDAQSAVARDHIPGSFARALEHVTGHRESGWQKPPVTCWGFSSAQDAPSATLYVPLIPGHGDDATAHDRVAAFMREENVDPEPYTAALHALADGPLTESATQNFLSYRGGSAPRFAVYLAPGTYRPA